MIGIFSYFKRLFQSIKYKWKLYCLRKEEYEETKKIEHWKKDDDLSVKAHKIFNILCEFYNIKLKFPKIYSIKNNGGYYRSQTREILIPYNSSRKIAYGDGYETVIIAEELSHYIRHMCFKKNDEVVQEFFGRLGERIIYELYPEMFKHEKPRNFSQIDNKQFEEHCTNQTKDMLDLIQKEIREILPDNQLIQGIDDLFYATLLNQQVTSDVNHHQGYKQAEIIDWNYVLENRQKLIKMTNEEILNIFT